MVKLGEHFCGGEKNLEHTSLQDPSAVLQQGNAFDCSDAVKAGVELHTPCRICIQPLGDMAALSLNKRLYRVGSRILVDFDRRAGMRDEIILCQVLKWVHAFD